MDETYKEPIKIKLIKEDGCLPTRDRHGAMSWDLYAYIKNEDGTDYITFQPGESIKVSFGIVGDIPEDFMVMVMGRESMMVKKGIGPLVQPTIMPNLIGEEWKILLHNFTDKPQILSNGEKAVSFVIMSTTKPEFETDYTYKPFLREFNYQGKIDVGSWQYQPAFYTYSTTATNVVLRYDNTTDCSGGTSACINTNSNI